MKNTKQHGILRFVIVKKTQDKLFTGICLDLDIVEQNENPQELRKSLEEAAQGYVEAVVKKNLNDELLNKPAPKKYWKILIDIEKYLHTMRQKSPLKQQIPIADSQIFTKNLNDLCTV